MKPIISITERAAEHLKEVLATHAESRDQLLRLVAAPGGQAGLLLDRAAAEDKVIEVDGAPILVLAPILAPILEGTILDCADTPQGPRLTLVK